MSSHWLAGTALLVSGAAAVAQDEAFLRIPPREQILDTLHAEHPRLLLGETRWEHLPRLVKADPLLRSWHGDLLQKADRILGQPPSQYVIPDGKRLLATSRRVLDRVTTLAYAHRASGGRAYLDRAWAELDAAAAFPDWNPSHFLDTAEMTAAFALGHDWLHEEWTEQQRARLREAIIEMGLKPAQRCYRGEASYGWWVRSHHNWNQVCNGGIAMGALAIAEDAPDLAAEVLHAGLMSLPRAMREFAPDGGWAEGPAYWNYATRYNAYHLAALETALGSDFGFSRFPGFDRTGEYPIFITAPSGRTFNYADGGAGTIRAPHLLWLARVFDQADFAAYEVSVAAPSALDVLWALGIDVPESMTELPLDRHFEGIGVVTMRSAWDDPEALFVGLKGGSNAVNHSHLELGSFIFEAGGVRWAVDLGADNYNMPGYFGGQRWTYYRLRAEGQNTIVLDPGEGADQDPRATGAVRDVAFGEREARASVELSDAYGMSASGGSAMRTVGLIDGREVLIVEDQVTPGSGAPPIDAWWFMHTRAAIDLLRDGRRAVLVQDGRQLVVTIESPEDARFEVLPAEPLPTSPAPAMQAENDGLRKLTIHTTIDGPTTIRVLMRLGLQD